MKKYNEPVLKITRFDCNINTAAELSSVTPIEHTSAAIKINQYMFKEVGIAQTTTVKKIIQYKQ